MPREFARIRISIAEDEDFENLSPAAQWMYLRVLLPDPTLNYAGVADWRPVRLLGKARGIDMLYLQSAAAELEDGAYCLFDLDTEEVLVRSFIVCDEILRNPKMAAAMVKAYREVASKTLRAAIITEVQKAKEEHPEYSSWDFVDTKDDLARLLTRPGLESVGYTNVITVPITNTDPGPDYQSDSVPIPSNSNTQPSTFNTGGSVSEVTHQGETTEPPSRCPTHMNWTGDIPPCRHCAEARQANEAWNKDELAKKRRANAEAALRTQNCQICGGTGQVEVKDNFVAKCECREVS